jgi:hypothetical protein
VAEVEGVGLRLGVELHGGHFGMESQELFSCFYLLWEGRIGVSLKSERTFVLESIYKSSLALGNFWGSQLASDWRESSEILAAIRYG